MMQSNPFTPKSGWETRLFLGRKEEMEKGEVAFGIASYGQAWDKNEISSEVENTLTMDCLLNAFSSDQIGALKDRAKAKYGSSLWTSLPCGDIFSASERDSSYFSSGYISIIFLSKSELSFHLYLQTMSLSNSFLELVTKL